jgi:hypothetical protein
MKTIRVKLGRPDRRQCRKVTLLISASNDVRLSCLAAARRVDRSELADLILGEYLKGVNLEVPADKAG